MRSDALDSTAFGASLAALSKDWTVTVSLGSVLEVNPRGPKPFNAHWVWKASSWWRYHKMHLFDFDMNAKISYRESEFVSKGHKPVALNVDSFRCGLSICYDLRFPELYRHLTLNEECQVLLVPAAFTRTTGEAHWHTLLKARAVENLSYVIAAAQWGTHRGDRGETLECYGHSIAIDPWGEILWEASPDEDCMGVVDLSMERLNACRTKLPALEHAFRERTFL